MKATKDEGKRHLLEILQAVQAQIKELSSGSGNTASQTNLIARLQSMTVKMHHEFCQSEHLQNKFASKSQQPSQNQRKLEILTHKMGQFKKRFQEQRVRTKNNQIEEAALKREVLQASEQSNYLEKELQNLEKMDENQQLIVQNLEEDTTDLNTQVLDLTEKVKVLESRLISQL